MSGYGGYPPINQGGDGYYGNGNQDQFRQYPFSQVPYGIHPPRPFTPQKTPLCAYSHAPQFIENCDPSYQFESNLPNFSSAGDVSDYFPHDAGAAPFSISGAPVRYPAQNYSFRGRGFMMRGSRGRSGTSGRSFDNTISSHTNDFADKQEMRRQPKSQQFYCDLCKISCAGPLAFRDHKVGQRHKKRLAQSEALEKLKSANVAPGSGDADTEIRGLPTPPAAKKRKSNRPAGGQELRCPLCDVGCTGVDAYTAHINGKQHQKTLRLHRDLGKPIPSTDIPQLSTATTESNGGESKAEQDGAGQSNKNGAEGGSTDSGTGGDAKPLSASSTAAAVSSKPAVGEEYIEVDVVASAKSMHYHCKLCDCQFGADAKLAHVKGRRHRMQYKNKVDPSFEIEPNKVNFRRPAIGQPQRDLQTDMPGDQPARIWEFMPPFNSGSIPLVHPGAGVGLMGHCPPLFPGGGGGLGTVPARLPMLQPASPQPPGLIAESRCVMSKHSSLLPTYAECQAIKAVIGVCEHGLKRISDSLVQQMTNEETPETAEKEPAGGDAQGTGPKLHRQVVPNEALRLLRGVVRVGALGQGLLLRGEHFGDLILVCSEWPTAELIQYLAVQLFEQMPVPDPPMDFDFQASPELGLIKIVASPRELEDEGNKSDPGKEAEKEQEEGVSEKEEGEERRNKSLFSGSKWRRREDSKWPVVTVRIQLTSPTIHSEGAGPVTTTSPGDGGHQAGDSKSSSPPTVETTSGKRGEGDFQDEEEMSSTSANTTGVSNRLALGGPGGTGSPIARHHCLQAFEAIHQAKWFQSKFNRPGLTVVARVVRNFIMSNPSWSGINEFAALALLDRLLSVDCYTPPTRPGGGPVGPPPSAYSGFPNNHRGTAPARLLRRFFESIASGLLLMLPQSQATAPPPPTTTTSEDKAADVDGPGSGDRNETETTSAAGQEEVSASSWYPIDLLGQMPLAVREQITREAQFILRQIAFKQMYKVLGMVPYSRISSQTDPSLPAFQKTSSSSGVDIDDCEGRDEDETVGDDVEDEDLNGSEGEQREEDMKTNAM